MSNKDEQVAKGLRTRAEKLVEEAEKVNEMKYEKSRKARAEALRKDLSKVDLICGAIERATGKICSKEPVEGAKRCLQHGGASVGPTSEEGKERALANLHPKAAFMQGLYGAFVMTPEEHTFYTTMLSHYIDTLDLDPVNILLLDRGLRNFILNQRKEIAEAGEMINESDSYNDYDTKFMRYMQSLGMDRKFNVSKEHKDNNSSGDISLLFMDES